MLLRDVSDVLRLVSGLCLDNLAVAAGPCVIDTETILLLLLFRLVYSKSVSVLTAVCKQRALYGITWKAAGLTRGLAGTTFYFSSWNGFGRSVFGWLGVIDGILITCVALVFLMPPALTEFAGVSLL